MIPVIGAGVSGLAFARSYGREAIVYERSETIGGKVISYHTDSPVGRFYFDLGGHWFHYKSNPDVLSLFDGLALNQHTRHAYVYVEGRYIDFPLQKNYQQLTPTAPELVSTIANELQGLLPYQTSTNYDKMLRQSYGETLYGLFFAPYNRKMFGIDELHTLQVDNLEVIRNVRLDHATSGYNGDFVYPAGVLGAKAIPRHLAQGINIQFGATLTSISLADKTVKLTLSGDIVREITWHNGLISSIPLRDLVKLITDIPPAIGHSATALKASPGCILNLGVKRLSIHGSKSWVYVADPNLSFYRFGFYSNIEPALAPEGYVSMYVEVTPKLHHHSDSEIQNRVLIDLHKMGIIVEEPVVIHLHRLSENYCLTSRHTLSILAFLRSQGIFSIGRYGAWRWSSQHEDILDAWELALHLRYTNQALR